MPPPDGGRRCGPNDELEPRFPAGVHRDDDDDKRPIVNAQCPLFLWKPGMQRAEVAAVSRRSDDMARLVDPAHRERDIRHQRRARPMSGATAHKLERVAFTVSRLVEFSSIKELTAQTGHPPEDWPMVVLKEVVDNALDACEEAKIAPEITIAVSTHRIIRIVITDNGPGLPAETIEKILDYSVRVSSREAYVSPSRGQQGNALKCIIAMPFALDGKRGSTVIEAHGQAHRIAFTMDPIRREPKVSHEVVPSDIQNGTRITVHWPFNASHPLSAAKACFVQMACRYSTFNPHLTMRASWDGEEFLNISATGSDWRKWRTCDPTSAYWYKIDHFERCMSAHVARDLDQGRSGRTVREFVSEFRGLARSGKQKLVLAETGAANVPLATFFAGGRDGTASLLRSCKRHTKPVKPEDLGIVGEAHLRTHCQIRGGAPESFRYKRHLGMTESGLPYVVEAAFAFAPGRLPWQLITGVNFSVGVVNPFERTGLTQILADQHVNNWQPVILILHYTCPRVEFLDRGKGALSLPPEVRVDIGALIERVTREWAKQRTAELRSRRAERNRIANLIREAKQQERPVPAAPSGALAEVIHRASDEHGISVTDLTVLSSGNDPYRAYKHRAKAEWFAKVFQQLVPLGVTKHLRGFFYLLVSSPDISGPDGKPFVNDDDHWQIVQTASKAARWLGLVPFERIIDERNAPPEIFVPRVSPIAIDISASKDCVMTAGDTLPQPELSGFDGRQTHRIILFGEKSSLAEVLRPIAEAIGAEMILTTGESSDTQIAGMAKRADDDGRPTVVLYFSDFDPSGWQMPVSVARKLQALKDLYHPGLQISLYPVALTLEQIQTLGLPSAPLKPTEKRADHWRETHGHEQTEIDALVAHTPTSCNRRH
jgi:hypothetical protein